MRLIIYKSWVLKQDVMKISMRTMKYSHIQDRELEYENDYTYVQAERQKIFPRSL